MQASPSKIRVRGLVGREGSVHHGRQQPPLPTRNTQDGRQVRREIEERQEETGRPNARLDGLFNHHSRMARGEKGASDQNQRPIVGCCTKIMSAAWRRNSRRKPPRWGAEFRSWNRISSLLGGSDHNPRSEETLFWPGSRRSRP